MDFSTAGYYGYKLAQTLLTRFAPGLREIKKRPGILSGKIGDFEFGGKFIFYFADEHLVHLGDQLFHQPLFNLLRTKYEVLIATGAVMAPYYAAQGLKTISRAEYSSMQGAVIITKNDLAYACSKLFPNGNLFIGVNYHQLEDKSPITYALTKSVFEIVGPFVADLPALPSSDDAVYAPYVPDFSNADRPTWLSELDANEQYLAFNDVVNSNQISAKRRHHLLLEMADRKKNEGHKIIYIGSEKDRLASPVSPSFVDIDLRGKLKPIELYRLFASENVHGIISYDTFVMHVASALRKDLHVVMRSSRWPVEFRQKYIPMFPGGEGIVKEFV